MPIHRLDGSVSPLMTASPPTALLMPSPRRPALHEACVTSGLAAIDVDDPEQAAAALHGTSVRFACVPVSDVERFTRGQLGALPLLKTLDHPCTDADLADALTATGGSHAICVGPDPIAPEQRTLLRRLGGQTPSLAESVGTDALEHTIEVRSNKERYAALDVLTDVLSAEHVQRRWIWDVQTVADELLSNAIFHAPVSPTGERLHAHRHRQEEVQLGDAQKVVLSFVCSSTRVALRCTDVFGSVDTAALIRRFTYGLRHGAEPLEGVSAGIGLLLVAWKACHLALDVHPGKSTSVTAVLDVGARRDRRRPRSVTIQEEVGR
nr:hypothetical protein [uncultured bacterium]